MKKFLLNLYFWPVFLFWTLTGLILLPFFLVVNTLFLRRKLSQALRLAIRLYGWVLVCVVPFMAPVKVVGRLEDIPLPCIFIANHTSAIDPYLFGAIPTENCFVTSWPFKIPVYGSFMKLAGYIDTNEGWQQIRQKCAQRLAEGSSITIWPEGHRSRNGQMGRFRKGAFQLALETGFPIQPVRIIGSGDILFPGKRLLSPGNVKLVLLKPLFPDTTNEKEQAITKLRQMAVDAFQQKLGSNGMPCIKRASLSLNTRGSIIVQNFNHHNQDVC